MGVMVSRGCGGWENMYHSLVKKGPWALNLTLSPDKGVGGYFVTLLHARGWQHTISLYEISKSCDFNCDFVISTVIS